MTPELIQAIQAALDKGLRVELIKLKSGEIQANTVSRKTRGNKKAPRRAGAVDNWISGGYTKDRNERCRFRSAPTLH